MVGLIAEDFFFPTGIGAIKDQQMTFIRVTAIHVACNLGQGFINSRLTGTVLEFQLYVYLIRRMLLLILFGSAIWTNLEVLYGPISRHRSRLRIAQLWSNCASPITLNDPLI